MQLAPTTRTATIAPGTVLATARMAGADGRPLDITAGRVLRTGVTDIRDAGWKLIQATHRHDGTGSWGTVGFIRTGDAWTAVELLVPTVDGPKQLWSPHQVRDVRIAPGVQLDAVWQVSDYGGDYTQFTRDWQRPNV